MALLQSVADHQFAAQVKALKENVAELTAATQEQNQLIRDQNALVAELINELRSPKQQADAWNGISANNGTL